MTKMLDYVEDMRARLTEVATKEQTLIRARGEALAEVDRELLAEVRDVTLAHETRRATILSELQNLASRIGAFPIAAERAPASIEAPAQPPAQPPPLPDISDAAARPGDWRKAVSNIKDELDVYFNRSVEH